MAAPATCEEFVDLVRKSGVVDDKRLDAYAQQLRTGPMPDAPSKLAGLMVQEGLLTHFQAEQIMLGKWRRFTIGKYKVLERLGSGGMGSVYLCEHKFMRRRVAVKVLPAAKAEDQASLERFYREARAAAALDHPNIVRAYDIDQDENLHFLVMEYVDGASLQEIIKKFGPMNVLYACHYIRQAAIGLQHAHEAGLVHRDIKPGNLLVDRTGTVKVLDMGLARFFHDEEDILTKKYDESVLGTADYLAPEQALDSHSVDIRADIYSMGATFYFTLTSQPPFNEGTVAQKLIWHQTRQPKPIRQIRPDVPEGVAVVIDRMMAKDRTKRYQTPAQVVDALAGWTTKPIAPPPDQWMPRLSPAAMGGLETASTSGSTPTPVGLPSPQARPPSATPAPGRPPPPVAVPRPVPVRQPQQAVAPRPAAMAPPAAIQPRPAQQPPNGAFPTSGSADAPNWSELAPSGANPALRRPTPMQSRSSARVPAVRIGPPKLQKLLAMVKARPKLWIIIGACAAFFFLVLFIIILVAIFSGGGGGPSRPTIPTGKRVSVSKEPDKGGQYRTIRHALQNAAPGDHIVVLDDLIDERLDTQTFTSIKNITIEAESGRAVWRPPPPVKDGQPQQSAQLLSLHNCDGLTLKNFHIQGQNNSHQILDLIIIYGKCPGLVLENVHFSGFRNSAIKCMNCSGDTGRPITLKNLVFSAPTDPNASAILFHMTYNPVLPQMQHIRVEDSLFEGPFRSGVHLVLGNNCHVGSVEFYRNRFFRTTDGFWFKKETRVPLPSLAILVEANTFFGMDRGLHFEKFPLPTENRSQVQIKNNLFVEVKAMAQCGEYKDDQHKAVFSPREANIRDNPSKEGNVVLGAAVRDCSSLTTATPADKSQLLRYPRSSPLATSGHGGGPVGVPPLE
jgi:serine/threonine protein kinase